jgi:hypothetical protein
MSSILITRPEHDDTTYYLSHWSKEIIALADQKGIHIFDLNREKAVKLEVESRLKKSYPNLVILNGHGNDTTVTGHKNEPLISVGENESLLKSRIVYAISCKSAKVLGPKSIDAGALSYTGYDDDFIFMYDPNKISKPCSDETAKLFLSHSQRFTESLIKGNTVKESFSRSKNILRENLMKSLSSDSKDNALTRYLWWDLTHFVSHGDLNAAIS